MTRKMGPLERFPRLSEYNRQVFDRSMEVLDGYATLPLLWRSPKLSAWYSVGLLARGRPEDIDLAIKYIAASLPEQYTIEGELPYGTFKGDYTQPWARDLVEPKVYDTYDPNNALFLTTAFIMVNACFADLIPSDLLERMRESMNIAVLGDENRVPGEGSFEDNLRPCYTNPWFMRIVCGAYTGYMRKDVEMVKRAETCLAQTLELYEPYGTFSEFNSPTYAGVTMMALGLTQFLPDSPIKTRVQSLVGDLWNQIAQTYNASLNNVAGPWDRTYGFDMIEYMGKIGGVIACAIGPDNKAPYPVKMASGGHLQDISGLPMMGLIAPYLEEQLSESAKLAFTTFRPHTYEAQAFSPPFDKRPRKYTYVLSEGLSIGGIEFDQRNVGGASINPTQFCPGVIQWDAGSGFVGWIVVKATAACAAITATENTLTIQYPPSRDFPNLPRPTEMRLCISSFPNKQLQAEAFEASAVRLPGLTLYVGGNIAETQAGQLSYSPEKWHDQFFYTLSYDIPASMWDNGNVPTLVVEMKKTSTS